MSLKTISVSQLPEVVLDVLDPVKKDSGALDDRVGDVAEDAIAKSAQALPEAPLDVRPYEGKTVVSASGAPAWEKASTRPLKGILKSPSNRAAEACQSFRSVNFVMEQEKAEGNLGDNGSEEKKDPTFNELLGTTPSEQDIIKALKNQVCKELWEKNYRVRYSDCYGKDRYDSDLNSVDTVIDTFRCVLDEVLRQVLLAKEVKVGIDSLQPVLLRRLRETFENDKEFPDKRCLDAFESTHNIQVCNLCLQIISTLLDDCDFKTVIGGFFKETLEAEPPPEE